jgi:putative phosphoesterase
MSRTRPILTSGHCRIGVIADTHGLLRPEAVQALQGCDRIVHAGDIGSPQVLQALRAIAPVEAIVGNVDRGIWTAGLPEQLELVIGGVRIHLRHDLTSLPASPRGCDVVISGHSHQPKLEQRDGVLYLNPGSAGPRRFRLPVSLGYLHLHEGVAHGELRQLSIG